MRTTIAITGLATLLLLSACLADEGDADVYPEGRDVSFKLLSFNMLVGGAVEPDRMARVRDIIEARQADVVLLQEHALSAPALADSLGWHAKTFGFDLAIISRYEIVSDLESGVMIEFNSEHRAAVYNIHLVSSPYGPDELAEDPTLTSAELVDMAIGARGAALDAYLADLAPYRDDGIPVILAGDFNEPSHLDWTQSAVDAGVHPKAVPWPASTAAEREGLVDAYRELYPDEVARPGDTFTPFPRPDQTTDRIDYVYYANAQATEAQLLGPDHPDSDVVFEDYPADHWSLLVELSL